MNWFSARSGACLSTYKAAARAACTSAVNPNKTDSLKIDENFLCLAQ